MRPTRSIAARTAPAALLLAALGCAAPPPAPAPGAPLAAPLVDGDCGEYAALGAGAVAVAPGVDLYAYQDPHHVWLCFTVPRGGFGILDLRIEAPALAEALNLHVSAQLGEWPADRPEAAPANALDERWWKVEGWTANPLRFRGVDRTEEPAQAQFESAPARELQLAKARFGRGEWRLGFSILAVRPEDGAFGDVEFPAGGSLYALTVH